MFRRAPLQEMKWKRVCKEESGKQELKAKILSGDEEF